MTDRRKRCARVSRAQKNILIDFMFEHRDFARSKITFSNSRENQVSTWGLLASRLNKEGPITKSVEQWKKCWIDIKSSAKKQYNERQEFMNRTDGASIFDRPRPLSEFKKKVLTIIKIDFFDGDGSTPELGTQSVDNSDIEISSESDSEVTEATISRMTTTPNTFESVIEEDTDVMHQTVEEKLDQVHQQNGNIIAKINKIEQQNAAIMAQNAAIVAQNEELLKTLQENKAHNFQHQNKKPKTIGNQVSERNNSLEEALLEQLRSNSKDEATLYSDSWGASFRNIKGIQKIYAKKAIEDILYLGLLGQLKPNLVNSSSNLPPAAPSFEQHSIQTYHAEFLDETEEQVKVERDEEL